MNIFLVIKTDVAGNFYNVRGFYNEVEAIEYAQSLSNQDRTVGNEYAVVQTSLF